MFDLLRRCHFVQFIVAGKYKLFCFSPWNKPMKGSSAALEDGVADGKTE